MLYLENFFNRLKLYLTIFLFNNNLIRNIANTIELSKKIAYYQQKQTFKKILLKNT